MGYKAGDPRNYAGVKRWRARPENKAKRAAEARRWRAKHPDVRASIDARCYARNQEARRIKCRDAKRLERATRPEMDRARLARFKAKQEAKLLDMAGRPRPTVCELCGESMKVSNFDHDHATGHFRGWLCQRCNRTLGQVKDSVELLRKMIGWVIDGGIGHGKAQLQEARESTEEFIRDSVQEDKGESGR